MNGFSGLKCFQDYQEMDPQIQILNTPWHQAQLERIIIYCNVEESNGDRREEQENYCSLDHATSAEGTVGLWQFSFNKK